MTKQDKISLFKTSMINKITSLISTHNSDTFAHSDIRTTIPTKTSQLTNNSGFLTSHQDISGKVDKVSGKSLVSDSEITKLSHVEDYATKNSAGTGLSNSSGALSVKYGTASGTACEGNDPRLSDARTPTSHSHGVVDLSNYMPKSNSGAGTAGYMKVLNIKTNVTFFDDPITFEIYQRQGDKPILCSLKFAGGNNADPNVAKFTTYGSDNEVYIYKASTNNWQVIVKKIDSYESLTVENINCNWGRWSSWATNPSAIFTHLDETISSLPSSTSTNPLVKASYRAFGGRKITSGEDLNDIKKQGFYFNDMGTEALNILNNPNGKAFFLLVEDWGANAYSVKQTFTSYSPNETYIRMYVNGNWNGWIKSLDSSNYSNYANKTTVSNSLNDTSTTNALSANQGKWLYDNKAPSSHTHTLNEISVSGISTATDLNTLKTQGFYKFANAEASSSSNCPTTRGGLLEVKILGFNAGIAQTYYEYLNGGTRNVYYRTYHNDSGWDVWSLILNSNNYSNYANKTTVTDNLTTDSSTNALSAKQGKWLYDNKASSSHAHGNISNDGKLGSESGKIVMTCTDGKICAMDSITKSLISDFPTSMTPTSHTHTKSQITDFPTSMTPTSHAHGNLQNNGQVGSTAQANKNVVTDANGKITTENKIPAPTTTTLSFVNTAMMSGTVKVTEKNGWATVYYENVKCTSVHDSYTPFCVLPHASAAQIYAEMNFSNINNAIVFRVKEGYLEGRCMKASQGEYGNITYPLAGNV